MRIKLILLFLLFPFTLSAEDEKKSYLCIADGATGFGFNISTKTWDKANFNIDNAKYIVRPVKESDSVSTNTIYGVWEVGKEYMEEACSQGFDNVGWLQCGFDSSFQMNSNTQRYIYFFKGSYVSATIDMRKSVIERTVILQADQGGDTPYIEIGKCSEI